MKSIFGEPDYALPEWMHALMETIDSDAVAELRKNDLVYTALFKTCIELQEQHTFLQNLLDGEEMNKTKQNGDNSK